MKLEWEGIKSIKDSLLIGIYANPLHINKSSKGFKLHSAEPILEYRDFNSNESRYWRFDCIEDNQGDDIITPIVQKTPQPLQYELAEASHQNHIIMGSSFSVQNNWIKQVSGYGFKKNNKEFLSAIVLELDELYIIANAGEVVEINVTDKDPELIDDLIVTTAD
ncbi:hypothetical protein [Aquisalibacillus elongatus]|uniref:Uncharacterized protein n=1 Tax=Aquisalibacillus elongatus TaxID=485577 RepID=A0A3N5B768_9BACI|nr:hypothetical protein [Aquisalibacillus elongatus]RPF53274.1 hypothetical protein EDC24_1771 [Aquisalibacillus elongatus]